MTKVWSLTSTANGARTVDKIKKLSKAPPKKRYGCKEEPLFSKIPIDHVVIDTLHLFLRISDVLINLLIMDLLREDGIKRSKIDKIDQSTENCIVVYECFLNEKCQISFQWYTLNSKLEHRDLTGPEKNRLFQAIKIPVLFPNLPKNEDIQRLWMSFYHLINQLKTDCDGDTIKEDSQNWVRLFCSVYQTKHVTPYIHAFGMHVHEFLHLYGNLCKFSQQGLEKLNDTTTLHYLRGTNH